MLRRFIIVSSPCVCVGVLMCVNMRPLWTAANAAPNAICAYIMLGRRRCPIKKGSHSEFVCTYVCMRVCLCQFIVALWMPFASLFFEGKPTNLICINASTCFINGILKPHEMGLLCRLLAFFTARIQYEYLLMCVYTNSAHAETQTEKEREGNQNMLLNAFACKAAKKLLHTFVRQLAAQWTRI